MTKFSFGEYNVEEPSLGSVRRLLAKVDFDKINDAIASISTEDVNRSNTAQLIQLARPIFADAPEAACTFLSACLYDAEGALIPAEMVTPDQVKFSDIVKAIKELMQQDDFAENLLLIWGKIQGLTASEDVAEAPQPDSSQPLL